jgi:uncharacterized protein (TIGR00725 family)
VTKVKYATSFGGSGFSTDSSEYQDGVKLGIVLAQHGYIVKCGGYYGLMEAVACGVKSAGGECIGITNSSFDPKVANCFISKERKAYDLFERLRWLIQDSEIFVVQMGGLGTLAELSLIWCLKYVETLPSIKICLIGECWDLILESLKNLSISEENFNLIKIYKSIDDFIIDVPHIMNIQS